MSDGTTTDASYWQVTIRCWGPDDEEGEFRFDHITVQAPDSDKAEEKAVNKATGIGIDAFIDSQDSYEVVEVNGPYESRL